MKFHNKYDPHDQSTISTLKRGLNFSISIEHSTNELRAKSASVVDLIGN